MAEAWRASDLAVSRAGADLSVFAYGMMHYFGRQAATEAAALGIDAEVVDLRTLSPLDTQAVLASARKTGKALIVYEDNKFAGYGAEIAALISEEAFESLDAPILRVAGPDAPAAPYSHPLQDFFMVNTKTILAGIRRLAAY